MRAIAYICLLTLLAYGLNAKASDKTVLQQAHLDHRTGYHYHVKKKYDEALEWYEKSASIGLAKSEYAIGRILAFDRENQHDYKAALPWIIRAAVPRTESQGYGLAQSQQQANDALDWYCKRGAAEFPTAHPFAKDPKCWHGRAKALMYGRYDIPKDRDAARALLEKSIAAGWSDAQVTLDKLNARPAPRLKIKPIDKSKLALLLFLLLVAGMLFRDLRVRQFIFGWLYKNSA